MSIDEYRQKVERPRGNGVHDWHLIKHIIYWAIKNPFQAVLDYNGVVPFRHQDTIQKHCELLKEKGVIDYSHTFSGGHYALNVFNMTPKAVAFKLMYYLISPDIWPRIEELLQSEAVRDLSFEDMLELFDRMDREGGGLSSK